MRRIGLVCGLLAISWSLACNEDECSEGAGSPAVELVNDTESIGIDSLSWERCGGGGTWFQIWWLAPGESHVEELGQAGCFSFEASAENCEFVDGPEPVDLCNGETYSFVVTDDNFVCE